MDLKIVNLIHIGDVVKNLDDLSEEERRKIANALNNQALTQLGYVKASEDNVNRTEGAKSIGYKN